MDEKESTACKVNVRGVGVMFCRDFLRLPQRTRLHVSRLREVPTECSGNDNVRFLPTIRRRKNDWKLFLATLLVCSGAVFVFFKGYGRDACLPKQGEHRLQNLTDIEGRPKSFYDTDGTSGYDYDIVPDIIHLVSHHSTDVARLRALLHYGGIYLDEDVFVVQSLRRFLRYEATVSCKEDATFGNMIMIHHKNSRFLRLYMDTYRQ
ncbi:hypothetical protein HPB50_029441 [Hyalomma asiaticum]|nr:hypothetical protein HPB50_029441 [Hyalomma asiaticum]